MNGHHSQLTNQWYPTRELKELEERKEMTRRKGARDAEFEALVKDLGADKLRRYEEIRAARESNIADNADTIQQFLGSHAWYVDNQHSSAVLIVAMTQAGYPKGSHWPYEVLVQVAQAQLDAGNLQVNQQALEAEQRRQAQADADSAANYVDPLNYTQEEIRRRINEMSDTYDPLSFKDRMI